MFRVFNLCLSIPQLANLLEFLFCRHPTQQHFVDAVDALHTIAIAEHVTIIEHVVSREDAEQQQDKKDDGHVLVGLRLLHHLTIAGYGLIGRQLTEELRIHLIIILVEIPLMKGQCSHSRLVAHALDDIVVHGQAVSIPLQLGGQLSMVGIVYHQGCTLRTKRVIKVVETLAATVGIE